jgi:hypothetical protein
MPYETDERLKSFLDANQLDRERMCLAVLANDERFSNVRPRQPRGGPDGGRDIDATFSNSQAVFGAVGFVNQANDSEEQRNRAIAKFKDDLQAAKSSDPQVNVFVFFTNVNLTVSDESELEIFARQEGMSYAEVFDRERIRVALDSTDGLGIRYQYLRITLSEAEQAAFFGRWGADIQNLISERFGKLEKTLNRLQFLAESSVPLDNFGVALELDREYLATELGHFRAFATLRLKEPKRFHFYSIFGASDNWGRIRAKSDSDLSPEKNGIGQGSSGGHWSIDLADEDPDSEEEASITETLLSSYSQTGLAKVRQIYFGFGGNFSVRVPPYLMLRDLDEASLLLFLNRSLAERVKAIRVYGNEYLLTYFVRDKIKIAPAPANFRAPMHFTKDELADEWTILSNDLSSFRLSFSENTPTRLYPAADVGPKLNTAP